MKARYIDFGEIEINGKVYDYDVIIENGKVSKRKKKASRPFRDRFGHTPLSVDENIPLEGKQLIVGTGIYGRLPVMGEVLKKAEQRGVEIKCIPTDEACKLISQKEDKEIHAILHVTC
ncbi:MULTISPECIES: MTH938/NDUFAF3 family protein [unclassified Saccharicrinis]|uniref:MTH938/NDUFAF3 family protein n=1 Tax=unclassified Saccharicrinis TaxID=2646859 RepID=UPI003D344FB0